MRNLEANLSRIIEEVRTGAAFEKEAASSCGSVSSSKKKRAGLKGTTAKAMAKAASDLRTFGFDTRITSKDLLSFTTYHEKIASDDSELVKAAKELRNSASEEKIEKIGSILNASMGLILLKNKMEKNAVNWSSLKSKGKALAEKGKKALEEAEGWGAAASGRYGERTDLARGAVRKSDELAEKDLQKGLKLEDWKEKIRGAAGKAKNISEQAKSTVESGKKTIQELREAAQSGKAALDKAKKQ